MRLHVFALGILTMPLTAYASARALPPCITAPITIDGIKVKGSPNRATLEKYLYTDLHQPLRMTWHNATVITTNCAGWSKYRSLGYILDGAQSSNDSAYNNCPVLVFMMYSVPANSIGKPYGVENPSYLPADILPAVHSFVAEYIQFRVRRISMQQFLQHGMANFVVNKNENGLSSMEISCNPSTDDECSELNEELTEVARGDFLHTGTQQILIRRDMTDTAGDFGASDYVLLSSDKSGDPLDAFAFDLACATTEVRNFQALQAFPCVTQWPENIPLLVHQNSMAGPHDN